MCPSLSLIFFLNVCYSCVTFLYVIKKRKENSVKNSIYLFLFFLFFTSLHLTLLFTVFFTSLLLTLLFYFSSYFTSYFTSLCLYSEIKNNILHKWSKNPCCVPSFIVIYNIKIKSFYFSEEIICDVLSKCKRKSVGDHVRPIT